MTAPPDCRRQGARRLVLATLPAVIVLTLALAGQGIAAAALFTTVFVTIAAGTLLPRSRLFGPHLSELPPAHAAGAVWITIDDGPDPATTPALLEILDRHAAPAAFFLIGAKARRHPELVRDIVRRGHLIGNHSHTHPSAHFWRLRPDALWRELHTCQQTLADITGSPPTLFRPPVGHHNLFLGPPLRALGLTMVMWNCRGFDGVYRHVPRILQRLGRGLRPGAIILIHDATPVAAAVLEGVLNLLRERRLRPILPPETALVPASAA